MMKISELSRATGTEIETIRYYEREALLPSPNRDANGYRRYTASHLEQLSFIRHCRALDMTLAEIRRLLEFVAHPDAGCRDVNMLIEAQLMRVRARLKSMQALELQLTALKSRCDADHVAAECGILHELVAAAHGEACACHSISS